MMSFRTCVYLFQSPRGAHGPELQGAYAEKLGWLNANRIQTVATYPPTPTTITLAPVSDPTKQGVLLAKIEVPNRGYYLVEYREQSRFDRGIPSGAVVIRELRNNGSTFVTFRQSGDIGWRTGEIFTDTGNFLSITVNSIGPGAAVVTVNPGFAVGTAARGQVCGDKYRGQIQACAAGLQCGPKTTPPLVSIDWFCQ
jgi:hypothetical protein